MSARATLREAVPFEDYREIDAVNWSSLKRMGTSPLDYHHGLAAKDQHSTGRLLGRVAHLCTLEPGTKVDRVAVYTGEGRRGSKEWKAFAEANPGKELIKAGEEDSCDAVAYAVRNHPLARRYFSGAQFEVTLEWTDDATGIRCKARLDLLTEMDGSLVVADLKGTKSIDARAFASEACRMRYFGQIAHYAAGVEAVLGRHPDRWIIIAAEHRAPHDVAVFEIPTTDKGFARSEVAEYLGLLKACRDAGVWSGRYTSEQPLEYPAYMFDKDTDLTTDGEEA